MLKFYPLTPTRWRDLVKLFGPKGACGGCWCMFWRLPFKQWKEKKGAGNRRAFRRIVMSGPAPGLLGYYQREPVAWCCVGPREEFPVLERHPVFARIDAKPVWTVTCLYIARGWRKQGVSVACLRAAVDFARRKGARMIEGYPVEPRKRMPDAFAWTGLASAFRKAGFRKVHAWTPNRPVMRKRLRIHPERKGQEAKSKG